MKVFTKKITSVAISLYPFRWLFVAAFFLPFLGWSPASTALLAIVWVWTNTALFIVLTYGPVKHFEGSIIWSEGWRPIAWVFLATFVVGGLVATVYIPFFIMSSS